MIDAHYKVALLKSRHSSKNVSTVIDGVSIFTEHFKLLSYLHYWHYITSVKYHIAHVNSASVFTVYVQQNYFNELHFKFLLQNPLDIGSSNLALWYEVTHKLYLRITNLSLWRFYLQIRVSDTLRQVS